MRNRTPPPFVSSEVETPQSKFSTSGLFARKFILSEVDGLEPNGAF